MTRYWKIYCSNGFCGCDEEWLMKTSGDEIESELESSEVVDCYTYQDGAAGINAGDPEFDPDSEEFQGETYEDLIYDNLSFEEISKEEFETLRDEELWEVRG